MKVTIHMLGRWSLTSLVVLACALPACSSDKTDQQATEQTTEQTPGTYARTVDNAKKAAATLSNPKPGVDPVCGMAIDDTAIIVTIAEKDYGVCSADCAEKLKADPEKYLHAGASP
jgi:YHS domain-containing protein